MYNTPETGIVAMGRAGNFVALCNDYMAAYYNVRDLIRDGYLGGDPVHMESYYCCFLYSLKYS